MGSDATVMDGLLATAGPTNTLVAFDFDWTIVDGNTDTEIYKLAKGKVPEDPGGCWTDYMGAIFEFLHAQGVRRRDYEECMRSMRFTPGVDRLLRLVAANPRFETVIVSDSNSFFIDAILSAHDLNVRRVFTNPAHFDEAGCLRIEYFHANDDCELSEKNLCKGRILREYAQQRADEGVRFDRSIFVGDGRNDFCPISRNLKQDDVAFVRKGFTLERMLASPDKKVPCRVHVWTTGDEIAEILRLTKKPC